MHIYQNAAVQTQAQRQSSNYFAISPGLAVNAIVKKLAEKGIDVTWGAVKKVIRKYQQRKIGYEHLDTAHLPSFKTITESDINHVKTALTENPTNASTDLMHILTY